MRSRQKERNTRFYNRQRCGIASYVFLFLLLVACNKKVIPPAGYGQDVEVQYIVKDCTIVIPADTTALYLKWSELCDTANHSVINTVSNKLNKSVKKNRITAQTLVDDVGITFVCKEDSLLKVIEMITKTSKQEVTIENSKSGGWVTDYSILFLALACAVFGIVMLFRR